MEQLLQITKDLYALTGLNEKDFELLKESYPETQKWVDAIIGEFYDLLFHYEPTRLIFHPDERPEREATLRQWYLEVVKGEMDDAFWRRQWVVGMVHIPRMVKNTYVLGIMSRVQQAFLKKCLVSFPVAMAYEVYIAFKRVTDVVVGLIAEGYLMVSVHGPLAGEMPIT